MKQVLMRRGTAVVEDVPPPSLEAESVLVRLGYSCISTGTELSGLKNSGIPLWKQALASPDKLKKALGMVASHGLGYTSSLLQSKLSAGMPCGYSAAGTVLEAGPEIADLGPGDRVAGAGAQCAFHAQVVRVPRNLLVEVPAGLDLAPASTVALGAVALQGVRRANPTLGETFVVLGLGLVGQLTVQFLKANGCYVIGSDPDEQRLLLARTGGMDAGLVPGDGDSIQQVLRLTGGLGADGAIITAATSSDAVVSTAFQMCRRKGRVVLVGDVGLNLKRADFYHKELDFFISSSYGPGRYDDHYEEQGLDYPIAYVRWTENRNMSQYLRLLGEGKIKLDHLPSATFPIEQAPQAYASLAQEGPERPLLALLAYPESNGDSLKGLPVKPRAGSATSGRTAVAVIGAGSFAQAMHLPNLQGLADRFHLRAVVSRTGHHAADLARRFAADYAATDFQEVLADLGVDAVLIATRHHHHAWMTMAALQAGKHVLVEKPLALTDEELASIKDFFAARPDDATAPILLAGFNRRFSPFALRLKELTARRGSPMILNYRMNAGYLPPDHWVHGAEGGGRNRGEACHVYDLFTFLAESQVVRTSAHAITPATGYYRRDDNFAASFQFSDGSVASLTYTALGNSAYPKEQLEVFVDGKVFLLNDYKTLQVIGCNARGLKTRQADKGHRQELLDFADAIQKGGDWPIPLWQQVQATEMALQVEACIRGSH